MSVSTVLKAIFGTKSSRDVRRMAPDVRRINELEISYQSLTEDQLKGKTGEFKDRLAKGETTDDILCEAFAVVKNACRRLCGTTVTVCDHDLVWDMVPFDVQLIGGMALHRRKIAEMATGEGKTLVATLPLYLNALTGKNCQLVTVNDYLARRDSEWMGAVYRYLGLTVGCLQNTMDSEERRAQYACDITYGTNSEFGFDYLRDMGMASSKEQLVQRDHFFAIIDEVDSILIDEARTPLIISGPVANDTHQFNEIKDGIARLFNAQNLLCARLVQEARDVLDNEKSSSDAREDAILKLVKVKMGMPQHKQLMHVLENATVLKEVEKTELFVKSDQNRGMLQEVQADLFFAMDEKRNEADLTEKGRVMIGGEDSQAFILPDLLESMHDIDVDSKFTDQEKIEKKQKFQEEFSLKSEKLHDISQLLRAYCLYEKDVHYVVQEGKVLIVDEHTGRILPGRRFSDGLHQALEAKENVKIEEETQTFATITIQNYFRLYEKLAGMTGTAETEASEFHQIYKLDVMVIPTNRPCLRNDFNDCVYKTKREKFKAIMDEVQDCYKRGQPVLLGTISVEDSEILSRMLKRVGIPHNVLNAKNHERESEIVARAGEKFAVTVATNMAGRGTDIKLGAGVSDLGGLHVIGSSRHDSRRIDRQLRGRSARQGDPGSSRFYVSLEDNLMRLFGSDRIVKIMERFGMEEGEELQHPWLNKSIETAQRRVEQHYFSIRKRTLEFDDVMNKQREVIYGIRKEVLLEDDSSRDYIFEVVEDEVSRHVKDACNLTSEDTTDTINRPFLVQWLNSTFPIGFNDNVFIFRDDGMPDADAICGAIIKRIREMYELKVTYEDEAALKGLERYIILEAIDRLWQEHLRMMDGLRSSIYFRAYAQKDPLIEYKQEAFKMFDEMMQAIDQEILNNMFRSATSLNAFEQLMANIPRQMISNDGAFESLPASAHDEGGQEISVESVSTGDGSAEDIQISFRRNTPKVGRNDKCPCGSGKKYKNCCGK